MNKHYVTRFQFQSVPLSEAKIECYHLLLLWLSFLTLSSSSIFVISLSGTGLLLSSFPQSNSLSFYFLFSDHLPNRLSLIFFLQVSSIASFLSLWDFYTLPLLVMMRIWFWLLVFFPQVYLVRSDWGKANKKGEGTLAFCLFLPSGLGSSSLCLWPSWLKFLLFFCLLVLLF